jgi:hypothetical protein
VASFESENIDLIYTSAGIFDFWAANRRFVITFGALDVQYRRFGAYSLHKRFCFI